MLQHCAVVAGVTLLFAVGGSAYADEPSKFLAAGEWSKPVADAGGRALRGRLMVCEKHVTVGGRAHFPRQDRREAAVYVELQDASGFVGGSMRLFCNFGKTDFRPQYKGGMHCEMLDEAKRPVPSAPFPFGGGVPASEWVTLPPDATIRLRSSPFGVHRADGLAIAPQSDKLWIIEDGDSKEYFLTATFTVDAGRRRETAEGPASRRRHAARLERHHRPAGGANHQRASRGRFRTRPGNDTGERHSTCRRHKGVRHKGVTSHIDHHGMVVVMCSPCRDRRAAFRPV